MSILRVSARNLLAPLLPTQIQTPTAAPGCVGTDLVRGGPGNFWQSAAASDTHLFELQLVAGGDKVEVNFIAAFDVRADADVNYIQFSMSSSVPWVNEGAFDNFMPNERGDGGRTIIPIDLRSIRVAVVLKAPSVLRIGELWAGRYTDTQRAYATMRRTIDYPAIENETDVGGARVTQLADYRHRFELGFDRLFDGERDEIVSLLQSARGSRDSIVLIPNSADPSQLYHGRIGRSLGWAQDFPVNEGMGLTFQESGRALGSR